MLLCCELLSAGARGLSIHDGVSIQICRRYWRRGQGGKTTEKNRVGFSVSCLWGNRKTGFKKSGKKKRPKKNESVFRFRFYWATEKSTLKSRFSVGKNREKPTGKTGFRFSVHNPAHSSRYCCYSLVSSDSSLLQYSLVSSDSSLLQFCFVRQ